MLSMHAAQPPELNTSGDLREMMHVVIGCGCDALGSSFGGVQTGLWGVCDIGSCQNRIHSRAALYSTHTHRGRGREGGRERERESHYICPTKKG